MPPGKADAIVRHYCILRAVRGKGALEGDGDGNRKTAERGMDVRFIFVHGNSMRSLS